MTDTVRFGVSLSLALLDRFDDLIRDMGYPNRSEAVRDLIRQKLAARQWEAPEGESFAIVSLVHDGRTPSVAARINRAQRDAPVELVGSLHVPMGGSDHLAIIVVKGRCAALQALGQKLTSLKGVRQGAIMPGAGGAETP